MGKVKDAIQRIRARDRPMAKRSGDGALVGLSYADLWLRGLDCGYTPIWQTPEVSACVAEYAELISNMAIHMMANTDRGDVRVRNGLSRMIDVTPNKLMTRKQWIYHMVTVLLTTGDGNYIALPQYTREGLLSEIVPVPPSAVSLMADGEGYRIEIGGVSYRPDEVIHVAINPDPEQPWRGRGWRVGLRDVVDSLSAANDARTGLMRSPSPALIIKVDGLSDELDTAEGRASIRAKYFEAKDKSAPWVIPAEVFDVTQVKPLSMTDLAIRDNLELDMRKVAAVCGVPAFRLGLGNYNGDEQANFVNTKIMHVAQAIQQELTRKLLYSEDMYFRFNPRSLYNYRLPDLISAGGQMVDRMALRRNEWRDWAGLTPDDEMDELLALENYIPVARLGDQKKLGEGGGGN